MAERKPKNNGQEDGAKATLDFGLGGLFKGLGDFLDVLSDMTEKGESEMSRTGEFKVKGLGDKGKGVYGFTVRSGIGGMPKVERFGNIRTNEEGPTVADVREPMVDLFDESKEIVVVAELPGVGENEVKIDVHDDVLCLSTTGDRKYEKEVLLPSAVNPKSMGRTFKNGILELRFKKIG